MQIKIIITTEQYGTELGELCPAFYHYECSETEKRTKDSPVEWSKSNEKIFYVESENCSSQVKEKFFAELNNYLNVEFRDFHANDLQAAVDIVMNMTKAESNNIPINLFAPSKKQTEETNLASTLINDAPTLK